MNTAQATRKSHVFAATLAFFLATLLLAGTKTRRAAILEWWRWTGSLLLLALRLYARSFGLEPTPLRLDSVALTFYLTSVTLNLTAVIAAIVIWVVVSLIVPAAVPIVVTAVIVTAIVIAPVVVPTVRPLRKRVIEPGTTNQYRKSGC